jgi:hypothetical protein
MQMAINDPDMKIVNERLEKIEELANNLAKITRRLASISKVPGNKA